MITVEFSFHVVKRAALGTAESQHITVPVVITVTYAISLP